MQKCLVVTFGTVLQEVLISDMHSTVLLKLYAKLAPGSTLILLVVNFDPIQEIEPKVGGRCSFCEWALFPETMVHTHIHTYIHTYIHTCLHTYTHTYNVIYIHTYILFHDVMTFIASTWRTWTTLSLPLSA